jgi:hypothetical protein
LSDWYRSSAITPVQRGICRGSKVPFSSLLPTTTRFFCYLVKPSGERYRLARAALRQLGLPDGGERAKEFIARMDQRYKAEFGAQHLEY